MEELPIKALVLHELAASTSLMSVEQYTALKQSIEQRGQLDPVLVFKGKIVDGRHRWLILQELGIPTIKVSRLPTNTTNSELELLVQAKEIRRHETASQLAVRAYKLFLCSEHTQAAAAKMLGANTKRVSEAKKIAVTYGRNDILELIHQGKKFNTGTKKVPFWTDSLGTILRWLAEHTELDTAKPIVEFRKELTDDEQTIVNNYYNSIKRESVLVRHELANMVYADIMAEE